LCAAAIDGGRHSQRSVRVVINRRLDIAQTLGAHGAHLGFDAVSPADARRSLGPGALIGSSTHSVEEVATAARAGVDYVHLAPVYAPLSKASGRPPLGAETLEAAARHSTRVLAQGGVTAAETPALIARGASGVAVTGAILQAADPAQATRDLREALDRA
jgi:thiamine-phosphate diphosphorylase